MEKARQKLLEINLFGNCFVRSMRPGLFDIKGSKLKAMIALLATAPGGIRSRAFLQKTLWTPAQYDSGCQNVRRALSDIKKIMGQAYEQVLEASQTEIALDLQKVSFSGKPGNGLFLEGLGIEHPRFQRWLDAIRDNPRQLYPIFNMETPVRQIQAIPSIAVLPFPLIVGNRDQQVLGDWLAEQICRSLSRSNLVSVISHLSSRALAKRQIEVGLVRSAFNVDYCVTGSLRVLGERMILDADLIDAWSGKILTTRSFDYSLKDFLAVSSTGVAEIVGVIGRIIADEALRHVIDRPIHDIQFHQLLVAGIGLMHQMTLASFARSREMIREVIHRYPDSAEAHAWLAEWYVMSIFNGWSTDTDRDTREAKRLSQRALEIDPDNAFCITMSGVVHNNLLRDQDRALSCFAEAVHLNPNQPTAWLSKGVLHAYRDEAKEAVAAVDKARFLSPLDPFAYFYDSLSSTAYLAAEKYDRALELADRALFRNSNELSSLRVKISALYHLGRKADAKIVASELLRKQPGFDLKLYLEQHPAAEFRVGKNMAKALSASGLK